MTQRTIDVRELPERLESVLDDVTQAHVTYVVARDGRPGAAIVPYEDLQRLMASQVEMALARLDRLEQRLSQLDEASPDVEAEIAAAVADGVTQIEARLAARRVFNARYDWGPKDSTEILREIREG